MMHRESFYCRKMRKIILFYAFMCTARKMCIIDVKWLIFETLCPVTKLYLANDSIFISKLDLQNIVNNDCKKLQQLMMYLKELDRGSNCAD